MQPLKKLEEICPLTLRTAKSNMYFKQPAIYSQQLSCADPENVLRVGAGVQIPRRGLTENFNMTKNNNLAIPGGGSG